MASAQHKITLITGANGGIGFELAAQLLTDATNYILLGSRSVEKGEAAVKDLQARNLPGTVELVHLDVNSDASIQAAAESVEKKHGRLDALVNNAAIGGVRLEGDTRTRFAQVFDTNVAGPYLVAEAFEPLLLLATHPPARIINVSSGGGSITSRLTPGSVGYGHGFWGIQYSASKAALNLVSAAMTVVYGGKGMKVFTYTPGFTVSNLGPFNNLEKGAEPTSEGAGPMVGILRGEKDGETGVFLAKGEQRQW